ncbi:NADP-dependent oxidoreductase domain-containing protein [Aspergillus cavernicola]|uniref:NADP-dependent oxidoreductase domain-containing protein n=1 Tax=Aspergillus cavernicola TaxID=176166 RepID=A0ABR4IUP8_9EURO
MSPQVELVYGSGALTTETALGGFKKMKEAIAFLHAEGVKIIDTAVMYGDAETILGKLDAAQKFIVHSKFPGGGSPTPSTKEAIIAAAEEGLKKLHMDQFEVYYLHAPDRRVSWEIQLDAINTLYKNGKIKRFGISNFFAEEVEEVVRIAKEKNWIAPTVFQGNYSAVARRAENELLPTLRKHGIEFYAYSPIAGGFLTKEVNQLVKGLEGRWDPSTPGGALYGMLYNKPSMLEGLRLWDEISKETGISKVELAYRWSIYNSALKGELGDKVIFGASSLEQLKETVLLAKKGPLSSKVTERIEEVWRVVEADAPLDSYNDGITKMPGILARK